MPRIFILLLLATFAFAAEDKPEPKSPATILYEKALADNSKDVEKTYAVYLKALEVANAKVLKALEVAKADLNDPRKGKLSIAERAKALEELDVKIKGIKDGAMATVVASKAKESGDLLGDTPVVASKSPIVGKWQIATGFVEFFADGTGTHMTNPMKWTALKEKNTYRIAFDGHPDWDRNFTVTNPGRDAIDALSGKATIVDDKPLKSTK